MAYIDVRTDYWLPKSFDETVDRLSKVDREQLIALIINNRYNDFIRERSSYREEEKPVDPTIANGFSNGKRVPYIGWFWRATDFYNKNIPIGDCGSYIGVMENNKWDYPERQLTEEECDKVIAILDEALVADSQGGSLDKIIDNTKTALEKLWPLFQTFRIT